MDDQINTQVSCYSGSTYPEKPRALTWRGTRYTVKEIFNRRREPEGVGFLVRCRPEDIFFDLFYLTIEDQWLIQFKGPAIIETNLAHTQIRGD